VRSQWSLPIFASAAVFAFVISSAVSPHDPVAAAEPLAPGPDETQSVVVAGDHTNAAARDDYEIVDPPPQALGAPAVGVPDPGTAQAIGYELLRARGWDDNEWSCLYALWAKESGWNVYAHNASSGAYGIPQALPGDKMATVGADWATNPVTQITWGLNYIQGRYGTPCGAYASSQQRGWY
jgi:hypothetical protein